MSSMFRVTPCGIWPRQDLRVRFSYLEEGREGKAIKEAEGLHLGLLSSRDGLVHVLVNNLLVGWVRGFKVIYISKSMVIN